MTLNGKKIAFVGAGVMGEAMIKGLLAEKLISPGDIIASDPHAARCHELVERYGLHSTTDNGEAVTDADIVVLSVKPQVMGRALADVQGKVRPDALVLSIAAGVKLATITQGSGVEQIVRAMPNTPGQIGAGMTVYVATPAVNADKLGWAATVLGALGETLFVDDEKYMDMATALNGSGPSYVFLLMEAMIDAGVHMGFSRQDAQKLVHQTMLGSVQYAIDSGDHPAELRNQVTSPGGTSAAALFALEKGGVRTTLSEAIWAAYNRSVELGKDG